MPKGKKNRPARARAAPKAKATKAIRKARAAARKAARIAADQRFAESVEIADDMMRSSLSAADVRRLLVKGIPQPGGSTAAPRAASMAEAEKIVDACYAKMMNEDAADAPYRRVKLIRTGDNLLQKALASGKMTSAVQALRELMRAAGAFRQHDKEKLDEMKSYIGDLPLDPTQSNVYASRVMCFVMREIALNQTLDPLTRFRMLLDAGAKIGMTYNKASMESKAEEIRGLLKGPDESSSDDLETADGLDWPATSRFGSGSAGDGSLPRPGAGPSPEEDG